MKSKFLRLSVLGIMVLCLCGCAGTPAKTPEKTPEQALVERAHTYWDAAKLRDMSTVYHMESGALDGKLTADALQSQVSKASLLSYEFKHIQIHDKDAEIEVDAKYYLPPMHKPITIISTGHWVLIDNQWYHRTGTPSPSPKPSPRVGTLK
jgi:hypothetical protein